MKTKLLDILKSLPVAHQIMIGVGVLVLGMASFLFLQWVSTPSYTLLYGDLDDATLAQVVDELERGGTPYRIEAGGSRVLVPQNDVHRARATLATAGVQGAVAPQGYELLDSQGLSVSDFRQRVDYQRALEGELARTLMAMDEIDSATVHLVIPEEALFVEDEQPVTASVLLDTPRPLTELAVESVTFLVSSSVSGLTPDQVTVADVSGQVLAAAGAESDAGMVGNRNLRLTREYEAVLAADIERLLEAAVGASPSSVVVRAQLSFDEQSTELETYEPDSTVTLREQTIDETFEGTGGAAVGGTVGVDGGPVPTEGDDYTYARNEATREFGAARQVSRTVTAPGAVEGLSVAVVLDDGSLTGAPVPPVGEIDALISAALGLDPARGDSVAVTTMAFPAAEEAVADAEAAPAGSMMDMLPQFAGGAVLVVVAIALLLMARSGSRKEKKRKRKGDVEMPEPAALPMPGGPGMAEEAVPALAGAAVGDGIGRPGLRPEVADLVQRQPEEIAVLLRGWLGDRR